MFFFSFSNPTKSSIFDLLGMNFNLIDKPYLKVCHVMLVDFHDPVVLEFSMQMDKLKLYKII